MKPAASQPTKTELRRAAKAKAKAASDRAHERYVCKTYGLQPGEYAARLAAQDGRCAMCGRRAVTRRLAVDHCHDCGAVRHLLCYSCNKSLGQWEFEPVQLQLAIAYLTAVLQEHGHPLLDPLVEPGSPGQPVLPAALLTT